MNRRKAFTQHFLLVNTAGQTASATTAATTPPASVSMDVEREVRFAVVMYGGVSLAIYINGVAQELLNMVRATAPKSADPKPADPKKALIDYDDAELQGTAGVYRKLGQYLDERAKLEQAARPDHDGKPQPPSADPIRTRFVVDVISGTSAGGINGVFLAKALARNQKMDGLKKLWLQEGDLSKLLNDSLSVSDLAGFSVQKPQQSLLNSERMYRKLLEALEQMDETTKTQEQDFEEKASPLVGELDLFITTTDLEGVPLPIKLSDEVVYERRHKNVFHFRYATVQATGSNRDDFKRTDDPFLAFAARCTSSFPFAFEPMCLADIDSVIRNYPHYRDTLRQPEEWNAFFSEYLCLGLYDLDKQARGRLADGCPKDPKGKQSAVLYATQELRQAFRSRSFGDGGYLDNKPFSYATSMLMRRKADVLVDRKLLYVEPSPEHPELVPENRERPDFAENVRAALLDLPRQETIREDIDRIDERNKMIERVTTFAKDMDKDLQQGWKDPLDSAAFRAAGLAEMIERYGIGYGGYHRLRVDETTQLMTDIAARIAGYDPSSDAANVIREFIEEWRRQHYAEEKNGRVPDTENKFLSELDLRYRLRRLIFLSRRVNDLGRVDESGKLDTGAIALLRSWQQNSTILAGIDLDHLTSEWTKAFRKELNRIKKMVLGPAIIDTRLAEERLVRATDQTEPKSLAPDEVQKLPEKDKSLYFAWQPENLPSEQIDKLSDENRDLYFASRLRALVEKFDLTWATMEELLECEESKRSAAIGQIIQQHDRKKTLRLFGESISAAFARRGSANLKELLEEPDTEPTPPTAEEIAGRKSARECLLRCYDNFTYYDLVTYPIQYGTGVGEANVVEIFRVSPEDAKSLIDERAVGETRRKLAGTALMSFGAFIDRGWRKNDMLWGRLDGAERLITALLPPTRSKPDPNEEIRNNLIREAHIAILGEEIHEDDLQTLQMLLGNMLARVEPSSIQQRKLRELVDATLVQEKKTLPAAFESALRECLKDPEEIRTYYQKQFEVNRQFDPENALRLISRATNITGRMLEGLAYQIGSNPAKRAAEWIARLGTVFWGMVTVAVPQSLGNLFVRHWLGLLYLLSFITIVLGIVLPVAAIKQVGWAALGISVTLNLVLFLVGDFIAGRRGWLRALEGLLVFILTALIGFGVKFIADFVMQHWFYFESETERARAEIAAKVLAGIAAGAILLAFLVKEWSKGLRYFLAMPHASFNMRRLFWLTVATAAIWFWLLGMGPNNIIDLEFAGDPETAKNLLGNVEKLRKNLFVDYLFIVAYTATFASYCVGAAKLFWQCITSWQEADKKKKTPSGNQDTSRQQLGTSPQSPVRSGLPFLTPIWHALVTLGFFLAAAQCLAGLADAAENAGLLWFLADQNQQTGLTLATYCATAKFALIGVGAVYSFFGFVTGTGLVGFITGLAHKNGRPSVNREERWQRIARSCLLVIFAAINAIIAVVAFSALWKHPVVWHKIMIYFFATFA